VAPSGMRVKLWSGFTYTPAQNSKTQRRKCGAARRYTDCAMQSSNKENVDAQLLASPAASTLGGSTVKNASVQRLRASARGQSYSPATAKEILLEALGPSPTREELSR
jgi:hypothetical protein